MGTYPDLDLCSHCGNQLPFGMLCPKCALELSHIRPLLVKFPLHDDIGTVELLDWLGGDLTIVNAARVSLQKHSEVLAMRDKKLITYLMTNRHGSPFEHVVFTFRVKAPLFIVQQWERHRMASYNEESGRWSEMHEEFYNPSFAMTPLFREYEDASREAYERYQRLLAAGEPKERARIVLTLALYKTFYFTVNARSLMNFMSLRNSLEAQSEIMAYAMAVEEFFTDVLPVTHKAFEANGRLVP